MKEHFGVLPYDISISLVDYVLKSAQVSGFTQKYEAAKQPST
jgi:hypothetical protein